jgi:hypothetical protein
MHVTVIVIVGITFIREIDMRTHEDACITSNNNA